TPARDGGSFFGHRAGGTLELCGRPAIGCFGRAECAGHATDGGRGPAKAADASGGRSGDRAGSPARRVQCCRPGGASAGAERTSDGELCSPKSGLRLAQAAGQVAGGADRQNAVLSNAPTRHPHAGGTADPARAGDQTGIGRSLSAEARSSTQEPSSARSPLPKTSMRDAGYTPNPENCRLIFGLYDKHVGLYFWIALRYVKG